MSIITRLTGGLGNQMFQYAAGRALANRHRVYMAADIGWLDGQDDRQYLLDQFQTNVRTVRFHRDIWRILRVLSVFQALLPIGCHVYRRDNTWYSYDPAFKHLNCQVLLDGYWQHPEYSRDIRADLRSDFTLVNPLSAAAQKVANSIMACTHSVGVHVRRGDYLDEHTQRFHGLLGVGYYKKAREIQRSRLANPVFFVFTDGDEHAGRDMVRDGIIVTGGSDVEQWELMRRCKHHIIANSSYSWWAAALAENPYQSVIAPRQWLSNAATRKYNTAGIYESGWLVI